MVLLRTENLVVMIRLCDELIGVDVDRLLGRGK